MIATGVLAAIAARWSGTVPRPRWCTFLVTYRCNARCRMCDSWRLPRLRELTVPDAERVFQDIGRLDVVRLSGGEPFLRDDIAELAQAVWRASRPGVLHVTTNGSLPDRVAAFAIGFPRPRALRFMVSFDGLAEEHDRNRGASVRFATALETVEILCGLRSTLGLTVTANHTVISPQSMADSGGLRDELRRLGVELHTVLAYSDSAMYGAGNRSARAEHAIVPVGYPLHPALAGADALAFVERERVTAERGRDPLVRIGKRYYLRGLASRLLGEVPPAPRPACVALRSHLRILPDGRVPVCQFNSKDVGNLAERSLASVWHGDDAARERRWVDACPGCWAECEVVPNALYTGDFVRALCR
ncbi:MAG: radical SAM protein [Acidobacteriota bacterium]